MKIFKGTKKYTIKSDVNPSAALSFFNNYEHTLTSTKPNYDYVIHLDNNLISMINTISYYVDENKKKKLEVQKQNGITTFLLVKMYGLHANLIKRIFLIYYKNEKKKYLYNDLNNFLLCVILNVI